MKRSKRRSRRATGIVALVVLGMAATAAVAGALILRAGDIVVKAEGDFSPKTLPKHRDAPIEIHGGGSLSTASGELPPILKTIALEFDRHGHVETRGLPVCTAGKIQATTVPTARKICPGAIVGKGEGSALVAFPEQAPFKVSSPITVFNGPRKHGNPTVLAHAYTTVPVPTTFVVPIEIEKIKKGIYGYRTAAAIPRIAGGYGIPISGHLKVDRKWTYKGKRYSYANARCETGRLQARGEFKFSDGTFLTGTFLRTCKARG
jgi:hypothetical protein